MSIVSSAIRLSISSIAALASGSFMSAFVSSSVSSVRASRSGPVLRLLNFLFLGGRCASITLKFRGMRQELLFSNA